MLTKHQWFLFVFHWVGFAKHIRLGQRISRRITCFCIKFSSMPPSTSQHHRFSLHYSGFFLDFFGLLKGVGWSKLSVVGQQYDALKMVAKKALHGPDSSTTGSSSVVSPC